MRALLLLLTLACGEPDDPIDQTDPGLGDCEEACYAMEETTRSVVGTSILSAEDYQEECTWAPDTQDCEECFHWMQETFFEPHDIGWSCGCGFTAAGVSQCLQDPEISEADVAAYIAVCEDTCDDHRLALP